jgi:PAS domain S-box-containing protein
MKDKSKPISKNQRPAKTAKTKKASLKKPLLSSPKNSKKSLKKKTKAPNIAKRSLKDKKLPEIIKSLRRRAEETARKQAIHSPDRMHVPSSAKTRKTLHELRVHQIQLEMQNEELLRTHSELDAAQARYFDLYDLAPVGYCTINEKGMILETNLTLANFLGFNRNKLVNQTLNKFIHKEDRDIGDSHRKMLFVTGQPQADDIRMVKKNGAVLWFHLTAVAAQGADGQILCHIAFSDITERNQAEEKLADERQQLNYILDVTKTRIDIIDCDYNLRYVDDSWQKIYGDPTGRKCYEYFMGRKSPCDHCGIPKALDSRQVVITEEVLTREGNRAIEVHTIPFQNKEGEWLVAEFNIDITTRKQAEEALRESEEKYRLIFKYSPLGFLYFNQKGEIVACNENFVQIIGSSQEKLIGLNMLNLPDKNIVLAVQKALSGCEGRYEGVYSSVTAKKITPVRCLFTPMNVGDGNILGGVGIIEDITERKDMEDRLRENEARYKRIAENMSGLVSEMDAEGLLRYNSPSIRTILGYDPEELNNRNAFDFVHPEDHDRVLAEYMEGVQTETEKEVEQRYRCKDGSYIWLRSTGRPIYGPDGNNIGMIVNSIDITERKKAEELLRIEEERFRTLAEQSSDIITLIDPAGKIIYENAAVEHILGYNFQNRKNQSVFEHVHPDDLNYFIDLFNLLIKGQEIPVKKAEMRIRHADGTWRILEVVANFVKKGENIEMIIANLRDITERKLSENALQKSEIKYRTLFESATDGIAVMEKDIFIECNQQILETFGYSRENFIGQTPYNLSPEYQPDGSNSKEKALSMINAALAGNPQQFEWMHTRYDGTPIHMEVSLNAIKEMGDFYIQVICRDISERKRSERELLNYRDHLESLVKERTKELEAFSYSVSHDLRAPLRSIEGFSQAIWEDFQDKLGDHGKDYLTRIRNASNLMTELIDDMLKLSRITRTDIDMIDVDLSDIAHSVMNNLKKSHPERTVNVKITDHLTDYADLRLMRIVFENLLGNAWKFTAKTSNAEIEFSQMINKGQKVYYVRDNGAGFDENYAEKLFAPFQRLHNVEEYPGTGVGLAIVRRIINRHGGKVWAQGQTDQGATFYFTLKG